MRPTHPRRLLRPDRLRTMERPFGWMPCRMLTNGIIADMSPFERQLYLVLALAADRQGVSFHGDKRMRNEIGCTQQQLSQARTALMERELLAYDGMSYQLLALPAEETNTDETAEYPLSRRQACVKTDKQCEPRNQPRDIPESVRESLRDIFGPKAF